MEAMAEHRVRVWVRRRKGGLCEGKPPAEVTPGVGSVRRFDSEEPSWFGCNQVGG